MLKLIYSFLWVSFIITSVVKLVAPGGESGLIEWVAAVSALAILKHIERDEKEEKAR